MASTNKKIVTASKVVHASAEAIFSVISDHPGTPNWVEEVKEIRMVREGKPAFGTGAIREVVFRPALWSTVQEEIVQFEEGQGYQYKIISGMPGLVDHLGTWSLKGLGNGAHEVTWEVEFEFKKWHWFSLILGFFASSFNKVQHKALASLDSHLNALS